MKDMLTTIVTPLLAYVVFVVFMTAGVTRVKIPAIASKDSNDQRAGSLQGTARSGRNTVSAVRRFMREVRDWTSPDADEAIDYMETVRLMKVLGADPNSYHRVLVAMWKHLAVMKARSDSGNDPSTNPKAASQCVTDLGNLLNGMADAIDAHTEEV